MLKCLQLVIGVLVGLFGSAWGEEAKGVPKTHSGEIRKALGASAEVFVYEGLPHQLFEGKEFSKEKERKDVTEFMGYFFYTPEVVSEPPELATLKKLLASETSLLVFDEESECGGFHPDYAVRWKRGAFEVVAMICFGCDEVIYAEGGKKFRYYLSENGSAGLKRVLEKYESKRPEREPIPRVE